VSPRTLEVPMTSTTERALLDMKLEVVILPVADVDRA
jgi:hypothetical protein